MAVFNHTQGLWARKLSGIPNEFQYLPSMSLPDDDPQVVMAKSVLENILLLNSVKGRQRIRAYVISESESESLSNKTLNNQDSCDFSVVRKDRSS